MFVIEIPYMNLQQIYDTKQVPRWIKLKENKFVVIHKDKALKIEQKKERFIMNCSEEEFFKIWFDYFDLKTDYKEAYFQTRRLGKKFKIVANKGKGIHIVNQDPFEAYVLSKLIMKVGFEKASELMIEIAKTYGIEHIQSMREAGRITWYEWPTPEIMLSRLKKETEIPSKVKSFLERLCNAIVNDGYDFKHSGNDLYKIFVLGEKMCFPIVGLAKILKRNFKCEAEEFADIYLNEIENKGMVYMYILHHVLNPSKEMLYYGTY